MVAEARYIKNRPDLPGPPFHQADSDYSVLHPPVPPVEAEEDVVAPDDVVVEEDVQPVEKKTTARTRKKTAEGDVP